MGQDDWVHVNCALWSAEVYEEEHDGTLQNVQTALSRGRVMVSVETENIITVPYFIYKLEINTSCSFHVNLTQVFFLRKSHSNEHLN